MTNPPKHDEIGPKTKLALEIISYLTSINEDLDMFLDKLDEAAGEICGVVMADDINRIQRINSRTVEFFSRLADALAVLETREGDE